MLAPDKAQDNRRIRAFRMLMAWFCRQTKLALNTAVNVIQTPAYQDLAIGSVVAFLSVFFLLRFLNLTLLTVQIGPIIENLIALGFALLFVLVEIITNDDFNMHPSPWTYGRMGNILKPPLRLVSISCALSCAFIFGMYIFTVVCVSIFRCFEWVGDLALCTWPVLVPSFTTLLGKQRLEHQLAKMESLNNQTEVNRVKQMAFQEAAQMATHSARISLGLLISVLIVFALVLFMCLFYNIVIGCQTIQQRYEAYYAAAAPKSHN